MKTKQVFKIKEPYWTAYKRYGWDKGVWGVGLNLRRLKRAKDKGIKQVIVKTQGKTYQVSMLTLTRLFRSERPVESKRNTQLMVVPKTKLEEL